MRDLASLTPADFEGAVGTDFEIVVGESDPETVLIRLTEVVLLGERQGHRDPFSLRFRGPLSPGLAQVTHQLAHAEMGQFELFLGPVAADSDGILYEAVLA
ncbi:MAG: hypothetical protein M3071_14490 [Actinomycetota bacterium]|nr:hypothetical protein [Actinomycetota bacterium]